MRHCLQIFFLLIMLVISSSAFCQTDQPQDSFKDRIFFGGGFGMFFGSINQIELSPHIGYKITEELSAGVGIVYEYISVKNNAYMNDFKTNIYGGRFFSSYMMTENVFPYVEYEVLSLEHKYFDAPTLNPRDGRFLLESFFVGAGYRFPVGMNSYITTILLYNLNYTTNSPYSAPFVWRMGFSF